MEPFDSTTFSRAPAVCFHGDDTNKAHFCCVAMPSGAAIVHRSSGIPDKQNIAPSLASADAAMYTSTPKGVVTDIDLHGHSETAAPSTHRATHGVVHVWSTHATICSCTPGGAWSGRSIVALLIGRSTIQHSSVFSRSPTGCDAFFGEQRNSCGRGCPKYIPRSNTPCRTYETHVYSSMPGEPTTTATDSEEDRIGWGGERRK